MFQSEIVDIKSQINLLTQSLAIKENDILKYSSLKRLFTGTGIDLEREVEKIFKTMGFEILEAIENRDDLILKYNDKIAVVEIKGVSKSAAEKHAAQLEKWAANYFEETGITPKGILLVNSFKDTPINEREEQTFPHQMIKYSTQREHCLLTTLQLITLYYSALEEGSDKDKIIESIFATNGIYENEVDWKSYIAHKE